MAQDYLKKLRVLLQNQMRMYKQLVFCESSCIEIMITCQCCKVDDVFRENKYSPNVNKDLNSAHCKN